MGQRRAFAEFMAQQPEFEAEQILSYGHRSTHGAFEIHADVFSKIMAAVKPGTNESLGKAIYELGYELNNRPRWVHLPLAGIRRLLEGDE